MCIRFRGNVRNIARLTFNAVRKIAILKIWFTLHVTRLKTGFLLTYLIEVVSYNICAKFQIDCLNTLRGVDYTNLLPHIEA